MEIIYQVTQRKKKYFYSLSLFAKIKEITPVIENGVNIHLINLEIINKKAYNEYLLQDDFTKRMLYNPLEQN